MAVKQKREQGIHAKRRVMTFRVNEQDFYDIEQSRPQDVVMAEFLRTAVLSYIRRRRRTS